MKYTVKISILIILILSLTACNVSKGENIYNSIIEEDKIASIKDLMAIKKPFKQGKIKAETYLDKNQTVEDLIEFIKYDSKYQKGKFLQSLYSLEEVGSDLNSYFKYLKTSYAGYLYFGGDEKFLKAKDNILSNIPEGGISGQRLEKLMQEELDFVNDAHFRTGNSNKYVYPKYMEVEDLYFGKDEKGYFNMENKRYIDFDTQVEDYLKRTLNPENQICYKLITKRESNYPEKLKYDDGNIEELTWTEVKSKSNRKSKAEYKIIDGIPYLKFDRCYFIANSKKDYNIVLEGAKSLSEAEYAILDLRGNGGGNGILPGEWIEKYSGNKIVFSQDGFINMNREMFKHSNNGQTYEDMLTYMGIEPYGENHGIFRGRDKLFNKEGLLIVLTDGNTASAGEYLVDALHHYTNTLFVGMPTYGAFNSSIVINYHMPNSRIDVGFGNIMMFPNEEYFQEYEGFQPDIWLTSINPEEQLSRLLSSFTKTKKVEMH